MKLLNFFVAKNQENKFTSGGRSMVEMLGVLAIIGVLSVGAIAGYGTAMYKYRMNKTVQVVTDFLQNLAELSTKNWNEYGAIDTSSAEYVKYGLLPASMCPEDYVDSFGETGITCKLPLGEINMYVVNEPFLMGVYQIIFYEGDIVKSCVDFLSHGWWNIYPQEWLRTGDDITGSYTAVGNENDFQFLWAVRPDRFNGSKKDITLSDIQNTCDVCKGSAYCVIAMAINNF